MDRIAMASKRKLSQVKGISDAKAEKVLEESKKMCKQRLAFKTAAGRKRATAIPSICPRRLPLTVALAR